MVNNGQKWSKMVKNCEINGFSRLEIHKKKPAEDAANMM